MLEIHNARKIGALITFGVIDALVVLAVFTVIILTIGTLFLNLIGYNVNDCDLDKWKRCKMEILTDYKTGVQYLSDSKGGLVKRELK